MRQLKAGDRFLRGKKVRLLSQTNEQLGVFPFETALNMADDAGLDLVELPSKTDPAVCRTMDYGKHLFDEAKRQREAKKAQLQPKVKEIKMSPNIDDNDFNIKSRQMLEFLKRGDKVRLLLTFRGREMAHPEIGQEVMDRMLKQAEEIANLDSPPRRMGRNITAMLSVKPQHRTNKAKAAKKKSEE